MMTGEQQEEIIDIILKKNPDLIRNEITEKSRFFLDMEMEDVDFIEFTLDLEQHFNIVIPDDIWNTIDTLGDIYEILNDLL